MSRVRGDKCRTRRTRHLGNGHWPAPQFHAIVVSYWNKKTDPQWVADELGVSLALIESIYHCVEQEGYRPNG